MSLKSNTNSDSLRWVVLLLAAAVILPTVCLLWFMTAAVRNERIAVRQKLVDSYTGKASAMASVIAQTAKNRQSGLPAQAESLEKQPCIQEVPSAFTGIIVLDEKGDVTYPVLNDLQEIEPPQLSPPLQNAWRLEFVEKLYAQAAQAYQQMIDPNTGPALRQTALAGQARCLSQAGKLAEAKTVYEHLIQSTEKTDPFVTAQSRLRLAQIYLATLDPQFVTYCRQILQGRLKDLNISTSSRVFLLSQILALIENAGVTDKLSDVIQQAQTCLSFEEISIQAAETLTAKTAAIPDYGIHPMNKTLYGYTLIQNNRRIIGIINGKQLTDELTTSAKELDDNIVFYRVYDSAGNFVCGRPEIWVGFKVVETGIFLSTSLVDMYSKWKLELYFCGDIFQSAADKQQMVYIWSSVLAIGLMLLFVFFAAREILHQARLNTMKNNFVATVTHELKTPLSSMRLLVDTLLDGNYTYQQQCREYLELISRENHRLSRMIDSFLTFSRMERGKRVFDMAKCSPSEIAATAIEAVQTKFNAKKCGFSVTVDDGLPSVYADKDAMVTVLVNLLDNACKYSGDDKRIELNVYQDMKQNKDGCVCFAVRDNGIGMTRRQSRRIFDKFYQVDTSLARRAEGCGLGLSIVKYIVDAHKGTIDVESKIGNGSVFIIKIPTVMG